MIFPHGFIFMSLMAHDLNIFLCAFCHLYIIFGESSVYVFSPFSNWILFIFLLLFFKATLYIYMWFANIFFQVVTCLRHFIVFYRGSTFILTKSNALMTFFSILFLLSRVRTLCLLLAFSDIFLHFLLKFHNFTISN